MDNDKATILRKEINLHQSTGGHYCIDFFSSSNCSNIEDILYLEKCLSNKQSKVQVNQNPQTIELGHENSRKYRKS